MKTRFALFIALMLSMAQGFAVPVDSLNNQSSGLGKVSQSENLRYSDSITMRTDFGTVNGFERMDGTADVNGIAYTHQKKMIVNPTSITFPSTVVGNAWQKKTITVETYYITNYMTVTLEGADKEMFSVNTSVLGRWETETQLNGGYGPATVTVTYCPYEAGEHTAKLVIKEKTWPGAVSKTVVLKGSAKCEIKVNTTSLNFSSTGSKKFTVQCKGAKGKVYLKLMGANKDYFTVSPSYLTKTKAENVNTITVKCNAPSNVRRANAYVLVYTENSVADKIVYLNYIKSGNSSTDSTSPDDEVQASPGVGIEEAPDEPSQQEWDAPANTAALDEMMMDVRIFAEGQNIIIESSTQQSAIISDLTGRARTVSLQVGRNEIPVNSSGVYVVRVGKESKKLMLR